MKSQNSSLAHQELSYTDDTPIASPLQERGPSGRAVPQPGTRRRAERANRDANPFGPDVILPEQFYDQRNGLEQAAGE